MVDLDQLFAPVLDTVLEPPAPLADLRARNRRRHRREGLQLMVAACVVVALVVAALPSSTSPTRRPQPTSAVEVASYLEPGLTVPDATLAAVGLPTAVTPPAPVAHARTLGSHGRPAVVLVESDHCPYCTLERWAVLVALSRFGTFTELGSTVSSPANDVFPGLQSWTFTGARFHSPSLSFDPVELDARFEVPAGTRLDGPQAQTWAAAKRAGGGVPYLSIGGRYRSIGAIANPAVLVGLTSTQIAHDLNDPTSSVAKVIDGSANYLIAAMCEVATGTPPPICATRTIQDASLDLAAGTVGVPGVGHVTVPEAQPAANAPRSTWEAWSAHQHAAMVASAAETIAKGIPGMHILSVSVTGTPSTGALGIPRGIIVWGVTILGQVHHAPR